VRCIDDGTGAAVTTAKRRYALLAIAACLSSTTFGSPAQDYVLYCMGCHGQEAQGVPGKVPPLAHALGRFMRTPEGRNYILRVPGAANSALSDAQLAAVLNWLATQFNADELPANMRPFTTEEVASARHTPLVSVQATRREIVRQLAATGPAPPADY
jgi:mono/diheme cytochrome c family protein